jgi:hypothetical protein
MHSQGHHDWDIETHVCQQQKGFWRSPGDDPMASYWITSNLVMPKYADLILRVQTGRYLRARHTRVAALAVHHDSFARLLIAPWMCHMKA